MTWAVLNRAHWQRRPQVYLGWQVGHVQSIIRDSPWPEMFSPGPPGPVLQVTLLFQLVLTLSRSLKRSTCLSFQTNCPVLEIIKEFSDSIKSRFSHSLNSVKFISAATIVIGHSGSEKFGFVSLSCFTSVCQRLRHIECSHGNNIKYWKRKVSWLLRAVSVGIKHFPYWMCSIASGHISCSCDSSNGPKSTSRGKVINLRNPIPSTKDIARRNDPEGRGVQIPVPAKDFFTWNQ